MLQQKKKMWNGITIKALKEYKSIDIEFGNGQMVSVHLTGDAVNITSYNIPKCRFSVHAEDEADIRYYGRKKETSDAFVRHICQQQEVSNA